MWLIGIHVVYITSRKETQEMDGLEHLGVCPRPLYPIQRIHSLCILPEGDVTHTCTIIQHQTTKHLYTFVHMYIYLDMRDYCIVLICTYIRIYCTLHYY